VIVIVDYGVGNLGSILNMLRRIGAEAVVSADLATVEGADKLILPGVGAFDAGMESLAATGLVATLQGKVLERRTPVLGVCLGLQLFAKRSDEGTRPGLGWLHAETVRFRFPAGERQERVPHMGWNTITPQRASPLLADVDGDTRYYFVHSYHLRCEDPADVAATTHYGYDFPSVVTAGNVMGTQFHPEKSHRFGMSLLRRFAELT
jgi:glutamine amidotransferase